MPQLMPFYWMNSVFMISFIILTLVFFYFYKNMEYISEVNYIKSDMNFFNLKW